MYALETALRTSGWKKPRLILPINNLTRVSFSFGWFFLFLVCSQAQCLAQAKPRGACAAFVDISVVPMDEERVVSHQTVVVQGSSISFVGAATAAHLPEGCRVIDGRERFLIPGLTDSHVHFFGYRRLGANDRKVEEAILKMLLANGITTAVAMEGTSSILALRKEIASGQVEGPRLYVAGALIQMSDSGVLPGRRAFDSPQDVRDEVMAEKKAGYDFVKIHGDLPAETYDELLRTAKKLGMPVVGHVPTNLGVNAALDGGQKLIVHAESYLDAYFRFHRELPTSSAEIDSMVKEISAETARAGVWVQPTLSVFRQINLQITDVDALLARPEMAYLPAGATRDWRPPDNPYVKRWTTQDIPALRAQYALMARLTKGLEDAGVGLLAGTDDLVPCQLPGFSLRDELEQLTEAGLTPYQALQTATSNPARFLGVSERTGTIAAGKAADLVLLNANPILNINNVFRQDGAMLRGRYFSQAQLQDMLNGSALGAIR